MTGAWKRHMVLAMTVAASVCGVCLSVSGAAWAYYSVTPICTTAGVSGPCSSSWFTSQVWVTWTWSPNTGNPVSGCTTWSFTSDIRTTVSCAIQGPDGASSVVQDINVEFSAPSAYGVATRPPDRNGWYNHPVAITFAGAAFSGIQSCTSGVYGGPDSPVAAVMGTCTDNAGKLASASFPLKYAATPPAVAFHTSPADRLVDLRWVVNDVAPISSVRITRTPGSSGRRSTVVYAGRGTAVADRAVVDGVRYRYSLRVTDQAGNVASRSVVAIPGPRLVGPAPSARLHRPPTLSWTPVAGATYYNVQLFRAGKILSIWPRSAHLRLTRTWRWGGRRYSLVPGRYRWFVWPGFGNPAAARYGRALGSSSFVIT
jgi:hypothetical protein